MKIGHTGITWGIPGDIEQAYRDTAELGFLGFETFGRTILEWNQKPGGYRALVERNGIPTGAAYCGKTWIDPATAANDMANAQREADALKELDGSTLVLACGRRPPGGCTADQFKRLADALNEIGRYCQGIGLVTGLHPHTGTAIETRQDIDTIMALLDPSVVGFAPDTGQIAKGGSDILEVMRTYRQRITHVHLKDWGGSYEYDADGTEIDRTGYVNYEPIGNGVLPMPELLNVLIEDNFAGWINVELDGTSRAPRPPRAAAAMSRRYLGKILGNRITWRRCEEISKE
ncbi:MAG TPA: sugar phosphate isomerase/epimerase family protein [Chloroflexota bacterium]|nr:sugar phosphate isomerase/epimerase family protein [Chloroflexota bacterium]